MTASSPALRSRGVRVAFASQTAGWLRSPWPTFAPVASNLPGCRFPMATHARDVCGSCRAAHSACSTSAAAPWPVQQLHARARALQQLQQQQQQQQQRQPARVHAAHRLRTPPCRATTSRPAADTAGAAQKIPAAAATVPYAEGDFVVVGTVGRAQGLKGEVRVYPITDQPQQRFAKPGSRLWLQAAPAPGQDAAAAAAAPADASVQRVLVERGRIVKPATAQAREVWAVKFKEVDDRTQASMLANLTLLLALCDREQLRDDDEFFVQDLVGMKAFLRDTGELVGAVTEVYDGTGTYDTLRLRLVPTEQDILQSQYRTVLVPFVQAIVPAVSKQQRRLELTPPAGLLHASLVSTRKLRRPYSPEQQAQLLAQLAQQKKAQQQQQQQQQRLGSERAAASGGGAASPASDEGERGGPDDDDEAEQEDDGEEEGPRISFRQKQLMLRQKRLQRLRAAAASKQDRA